MRYFEGLKYLTPAEVAQRLGIPTRGILVLVQRGKLRARPHKGHLYVAQREVERFRQEEHVTAADWLAMELLKRMGVRTKLILSWRNGQGRG